MLIGSRVARGYRGATTAELNGTAEMIWPTKSLRDLPSGPSGKMFANFSFISCSLLLLSSDVGITGKKKCLGHL